MLDKLNRLRFFVDDFPVYVWHLKNLRFKKLYNHIWCRLNVRDIGGGFLDQIYKRFPRLLSVPKEVEFEITTRCGLRCVMCEHTHWDHTSYAKQDISYEELVSIHSGWPELKYVGIQGMGNPFLNKSFRKIVKYLSDSNIFINIVENFCEVNDQDMDVIVKYVDRIDLSLDASYKTLYEEIRPGSNFENVEKNLRKAIELKKKFNSPYPSFFVRIVAFEKNYHDIPDIIRFVGNLDLNNGGQVHIEISGLLLFDKIKHLAGDSIEAPTEVVEACVKAQREFGKRIRLSFQRSKVNPPVSKCAKWVQPFVMANGDVVLDCGVMMSDNRKKLHEDSFGNIKDFSIKEIWNSQTYKEIRESVNVKNGPISEICNECRSFNNEGRSEAYGKIYVDQEIVNKFKGERTRSVISKLSEEPRLKKIYIKEFKSDA